MRYANGTLLPGGILAEPDSNTRTTQMRYADGTFLPGGILAEPDMLIPQVRQSHVSRPVENVRVC
jgi:hypothetical protein